MSRAFTCLAIFLLTAAVPCGLLRADDQTTAVITSGSVYVSNGPGSWTSSTELLVSATLSTNVAPYGLFAAGGSGYVSLSPASLSGGVSFDHKLTPSWRPTPPQRIAPGKVFYVITQGAGLGDNVRRVSCTGKETVSDTIGAINGLSQASGKKIWIARPSASDSAKGEVLPVDWDAITRRGETATNYRLMPGDRLYIGEEAATARFNRLCKQTTPVERTMGIVNLSRLAVASFQTAPCSSKVIHTLSKKGLFGDDPQVKRIIEETVRAAEEESRKSVGKSLTEPKPGQ